MCLCSFFPLYLRLLLYNQVFLIYFFFKQIFTRVSQCLWKRSSRGDRFFVPSKWIPICIIYKIITYSSLAVAFSQLCNRNLKFIVPHTINAEIEINSELWLIYGILRERGGVFFIFMKKTAFIATRRNERSCKYHGWKFTHRPTTRCQHPLLLYPVSCIPHSWLPADTMFLQAAASHTHIYTHTRARASTCQSEARC